MAVAGLGLLLWARLILVSDMPRMALAEPEAAPDAEVAADEPAVGADASPDDGPAPH
jgi:hypothetical protein